MSLERPSPTVDRRAAGLACADALLECHREFGPLPDAAHARVKRRLRASLRRTATRRARFLQPLLIGGLMLLCGAAFGIALDRLVLRPPPSLVGTGAAKPEAGFRARKGASKVAASGQLGGQEPAADQLTAGASTATPATSGQSPAAVAPAAGSVLAVPAAAPPARAQAVPRKPAIRSEVPAVEPAPPATAPPAVVGVPSAAARPLATEPAAPVALAPTTAPAKAAPASVDGLSEERLLAAAVRSLRAQRDPKSALVALDEYRARFPQGRLLVEADILRVDALTALSRREEALATLDRLDLGGMPGGNERLLQRGELRAAAARWREAEGDFDEVLSRGRGQNRELAERALWGRAQSRARLGNKAGAGADAEEYLRRFPKGRFAAQAGGLLDADDPGSPR